MYGFSMLMPFADIIATRLLVSFFLFSFLSVIFLVIMSYLKFTHQTMVSDAMLFVGFFILVISTILAGSFGVLFVVFNQVKSIALRDLEQAKIQ